MAFIALDFLIPISALAEQRYTVTNIGTLGGSTLASGINNQGQVVGFSIIGFGAVKDIC
jgi:hypothetical protein